MQCIQCYGSQIVVSICNSFSRQLIVYMFIVVEIIIIIA